MRNRNLIAVFFILFLFGVSIVVAEGEKKLISGTVSPTLEGVRVVLIKDLSIVSETLTDEDGRYYFENIPDQEYGLLFITKTDLVYAYDDKINNVLGKRSEDSDKVIVNIEETINIGDFSVDIDLMEEKPDYVSEKVFIWFNENLSSDQIDSLIDICNCSIYEKVELGYDNYYLINVPIQKTVLEVVRDFYDFEEVDYVEWQSADLSVGLENSEMREYEEEGLEIVNETEVQEKDSYFYVNLILMLIILLVFFLKYKNFIHEK